METTTSYIRKSLSESKGFRKENLTASLVKITTKEEKRLSVFTDVINKVESEYHSQGSYSFTSYHITTSTGRKLTCDNFEGHMSSAIGMTVGAFIVKCIPTTTVGLFEGKRVGFDQLHLQDGDKIGNYTLHIKKGRGYSGGHNSQSDFRTVTPDFPKNSEWCINTTREGQTSGYYPEITYID